MLCFLYPHICACVLNEFQEIKLQRLDRISVQDAIFAMEKFAAETRLFQQLASQCEWRISALYYYVACNSFYNIRNILFLLLFYGVVLCWDLAKSPTDLGSWERL